MYFNCVKAYTLINSRKRKYCGKKTKITYHNCQGQHCIRLKAQHVLHCIQCWEKLCSALLTSVRHFRMKNFTFWIFFFVCKRGNLLLHFIYREKKQQSQMHVFHYIIECNNSILLTILSAIYLFVRNEVEHKIRRERNVKLFILLINIK